MHYNNTIAVIDSGIGGISVMKQLIEQRGCGNYIYFADNDYMPYGNKNKRKLEKRLLGIIKYLQEKYLVKHTIIACNTASSIINHLNLPNVSTMQFDRTKTYFATKLTKNMLEGYSVIADVTLAKQIEKNIFNEQKLDKVIKTHVQRHKLNLLQCFVLGCTHYELVKPIFEKYCANSQVLNNSSNMIKDISFTKEKGETNIKIILSRQNKQYENQILKLIRRK